MTGERPSAERLKLLYTADLSDGLANKLLKSAVQRLILPKGSIKIQSASSIYQAQSQVNTLKMISRNTEYHTTVGRMKCAQMEGEVSSGLQCYSKRAQELYQVYMHQLKRHQQKLCCQKKKVDSFYVHEMKKTFTGIGR